MLPNYPPPPSPSPSPSASPSSASSFLSALESQRSSMLDDEPLIIAQYRPSRPVTDEIRTHCHIYLDEQLYTSALTLLTDLVTSGASHPQCLERPAFAPVPFHIELVSCLLIHPRHTTQAPPNEQLELASRSITFLRNVLSILGPINANLEEAFCLSSDNPSRGSRRSRNTTEIEDGTSGSDSDREDRMRGIIANRGRIRRCAKDFWHMVGWAFNCSVKYPKRWKYWKVWLDYMLDVLDEDWRERERLDREDGEFIARQREDQEADCEQIMLRKCLLVRYLSEVKGRSTPMKRVVRSVFADGGPESLKDFPEVFPNETKEVKLKSGQKRKRAQFGDYDDDEAEAAFDSSELTDQTLDVSEDMEDEEDAQVLDSWLGGPESIALRQRVLTLLSRVSDALPDCFVGLRDLYEAIYASVKPLPLPAFSLLVAPSWTQFPTMVYVSLTQLLLLRLLPNNAPRPQKVSRRDVDDLTQEILEKCFLPFPAMTSSVEDNAKVSILVENMFRLYLKLCPCYHTPSLEEAIETGIVARENQIKGDKKRKGNGARGKGEDGDLWWLKSSSQRLRGLLSWVEQKNEGEDWED